MKFKHALLATAAVALLPFTAGAADRGFYLDLHGGVNWLTDSDFDTAGTSNELDFDTGWAVGTAVGYQYGNGFRSEIELTYRTNDVDGLNGVGTNGDVKAWNLFLNGYWDFRNSSRWTPYVGAGLGWAWVDFDSVGPVGLSQVDDNDGNFAVQGIAGITFQATSNVDLFADYRYLTAFDQDLTNNGGASVDADYDSHTVMAGLRIHFGKPSPAPVRTAAPVPPGQEPRNFLVFFDFNKANITEEARRIIISASEAAKTGGATRIEITGHADRSGTDTYNLALSKRRAEIVKKELLRLGLASADVVTFAKGEREPLVPTDDGVREPQNRRVEIVYTVTTQPRM